MKRRVFGVICAAVICAMLVCGSPFPARAAAPGVAYRTQSEIRSFIAASGADESDPLTFAVDPSVSAPYAPGVLSDATLNSSVAFLNNIRYIAGLNHNVKLKDDYNGAAAAAAMLNAANDVLSHYPARPAGISDSLYELGSKGAASADISMRSKGFSRDYPTVEEIYAASPMNTVTLRGWMGDSDASNISRVGHRRWILAPKLGSVGFGSAWTRSEEGGFYYTTAYYALYVHDFSDTTATQTKVAWPAQNMPVEYFDDNFAWSLSYGSDIKGSVSVTLTRQSDGRKWTFSTADKYAPASSGKYFNVESDAIYGTLGCRWPRNPRASRRPRNPRRNPLRNRRPRCRPPFRPLFRPPSRLRFRRPLRP